MPPGPAGPIHPTQAFAAPAAAVAMSGANTVAAAPESKKRDLSVNKLIAGAGAAATSAVLGSFFGALGTVGGAALGSVFSAIVTWVMQRSLDKTRDTVKARVKIPGGDTVKVASTTEVPAPRGASDGSTTRVFVTPGDQATEVISAVPAVDAGPPKSRRRLLVMTGFTVVVFAIGMLVITGIELVKGSPLNTSSSTSQRSGGTSLGSVLGGSNSASTETSTKSTTTSETTSEKPTTEATKSKKSTDENSSAVPGTGFGANQQESTSTSSTRATPTPTPTSGSGANDQSDGGAAPQPGGGAAPANQE